MNNNKKTPLQIAVRIFIIVGLIILLILLSFGIIKFVPKALDSIKNLKNKVHIKNATTTEQSKISEPIIDSPKVPDPNNYVSTSTVVVEQAPTPVPPPASTYSPAPVNQVYKGPADLVSAITSTNIGTNGLVSVKFKVSNTGVSGTGIWKFRANLPTNNTADQNYNSPNQSSIPAGKASYFTLSFYNLRNGNNQIIINVDSDNQVAESNENNNQTIGNINSTNTSYQNPGRNNNGPADILFKSTEVGVIDRNTGAFTSRNYFYAGERLAVRMVVSNNGGQDTGSWSFRSVINNSTNGIVSGTLASLRAGESRTYITSYDFGTNDTGLKTVTITLDNNNQVAESREDNNVTTVSSDRR